MIAGGEGQGSKEVDGVEAKLWVPAAWCKVAGGGGSAMAQSAAAKVSGGVGVPARDWWG